MDKIEGSIKVYLTWNPEADEWEVDGTSVDGHPLDWAVDPYVPDKSLRELDQKTLNALEHAHENTPDGEDLGFMLGHGITRQAMRRGAVKPANGHRPISRGLIDAIDAVIDGALASHHESITHEARATLRARLIPIFASVDENAYQRGKHAGAWQ